MRSLEGDVGANGLMVRHEDAVHEVLVDDDAVLRDVDTLESWAAAAGAQRRWRP
jgi:CTP:molybdopterin cytidylyltransferase MocA